MKKFILTLATLLSFSTFATEFKQGTHFTRLENPVPTATPTVTEYFAFYCGHCYRWSKTIVPKLKQTLPTNITFKQVHLSGTPVTEQFAKSFVLAQQLGTAQQLETKVFKAMHQDNIRPQNLNDVKLLVINSGMNEKDYRQTHSFMINAQVKKQSKELNQFQINAVPSLVINGQYKINLRSMRSEQELLALVQYLAQR